MRQKLSGTAEAAFPGPGHGVPMTPLAPFLFLAAALSVLLLLLGRFWWLPAQAPLDVNEGWNAVQALRAFQPGAAGISPLYPPPEALTANNYPPLSFFLVGALGQLTGDNIVAGRFVALLSQVLTGLAILAALRRLIPASPWRWLGPLLFAGFAATFLRRYTAMNDPQWLAEAAMVWAFVLLLPTAPSPHDPLSAAPLSNTLGQPPRRGAVVTSALLVVAGLLCKHNAVVLPLAMFLWLFLAHRRALLPWCLTGVVLAGLAAAAMLLIWGTAPFTGILGASRSYSFSRMLLKGGPDLLVLLPGLLACLPLWRFRHRPEGLAALLPLLIAVPVALVQRAGDGVDVNAAFEAVIALSIALPVACAARPATAGRRALLAALPLLVLAPFAAGASLGELRGREAAQRRWGDLVARVAATPGPVACDDQAVCYWAGRDAGMDVFLLKQRLLKGQGAPVRAAIEAHRFALIELRTDDTSWHADLLRPLILQHYVPAYAANGIALLVPRPAGPPPNEAPVDDLPATTPR